MEVLSSILCIRGWDVERNNRNNNTVTDNFRAVGDGRFSSFQGSVSLIGLRGEDGHPSGGAFAHRAWTRTMALSRTCGPSKQEHVGGQMSAETALSFRGALAPPQEAQRVQ